MVRAENSRISNSELRTRIVEIVNEYFAIDNWDFGDTFYFSELAAYIHQELNQDIGSVVIVPKASTQKFGDLFQIVCNPNEIFVSSATVDDVEVIDSITASRLQTVGVTSDLSGRSSDTPRGSVTGSSTIPRSAGISGSTPSSTPSGTSGGTSGGFIGY